MSADENGMKVLRRASARSARQLVWAQIVLTFALAGSLWITVLWGAEPISDAASIPWWMIAIGFFVAESWVVLMHFRSESSSFSFFEIPMMLGLLFTDPTWMVPAVVIGSFVAQHMKKRLPIMKTAFNSANFALHVAVGWLLLDFFLGSADALKPASWAWVFLAAILSGVVELANIWIVLHIIEGRVTKARTQGMALFGFVVTVTNNVQALVMALLLKVEPLSLFLLGLTTLVLYVAYRSYLAEKDQRERVEFLYSSTRNLKSGDSGTPAGSLVEEAAGMFRAAIVELHLAAVGPDPEDLGTILTWHSGEMTSRDMAIEDRELVTRLAYDSSPALIVGSYGPCADYIADRGFKDAMIGALTSGEGRTSLLVVANRLGDVTTFMAEDLQLFDTLVQHAALALENDQLELAITQLRSLERELAHQASHDGLTGLANRAVLGRRLDELLQEDTPELSLIYVDLDDFKVVNDTLGHGAGDKVLIEAARRLQTCIRPTDLAVRLGGDEFAVLLIDNNEPERVARRVLASLNQSYFIEDDQSAAVGASAGLASWQRGLSASSLIAHADVAMYTAKEQGKGSVCVFQEEMRARVSARQTLRSQLRTAVAAEQFKVLYQPIVDLATGKVVAAEALVRWISPEGLLLPQGFIDEAERSGLIVPIDTFVFTQVLKDLNRLDAEGHHDLWLTSNLSMRTLQERDLVDRVRSEVAAAGMASSRIVLEVTETALMHDPDFTTAQLNRLRNEGMRVALDDFGTGYSSLSYLRRFPVDILKIAQPFVSDLDSGDDTFVRAMSTLGHTLGLGVLAEGIETEHQLRKLERLDIEYGQGYYFARPFDIDSLAATLEAHRGDRPVGLERAGVGPGDPQNAVGSVGYGR